MASTLEALREGLASGAAEAAPSSLREGSQEPDHEFLLRSAARASFFLEPTAFNASGQLRPDVPIEQAVRKVGHGLHFVDGPFREYVHTTKLARLVSELGWQDPVVVQTLYRLMPTHAAGVDRHQDSATLHTEPPSVMGLWLALEDAGATNGCLRVRPGSHSEPIWERLVRRPCTTREGVCLRFANQSTGKQRVQPEEDAFDLVEVSAGDLVVTHWALDHFSATLEEPGKSRQSIQIHVVEAGATWAEDNWLQYPPGLAFPRLGHPDAPGGSGRQAEL